VKNKIAMQCHTIRRLALLYLLACQNYAAETQRPFEPGPLEPLRVKAAARQAGFKVRDLKADIPVAVRPRLPFVTAAYSDESLIALRRQYPLEKIVAGGRDEWQSQLLLKEWVHQAIPPGSPKVSYNNALEILEHAAHGATFWCTHYAVSYAECAAARLADSQDWSRPQARTGRHGQQPSRSGRSLVEPISEGSRTRSHRYS
jgi:hypothetical protein